MTWTPGPWRWTSENEQGVIDLRGSDGSYVLMDVGVVRVPDDDLIAAAPEMAEFITGLAARNCHRGGEWVGPEGSGVGPHCHDKCSHVQARAALARMRGEA